MIAMRALFLHIKYMQREFGEGRSYAVMWRKYKRRVLLAMSSLAFAQLVSYSSFYGLRSTYECVSQNGINGEVSFWVVFMKLTESETTTSYFLLRSYAFYLTKY
jgi:hypothetical protein